MRSDNFNDAKEVVCCEFCRGGRAVGAWRLAEMPHHYCVPGCTQNSSGSVAGGPVSFHSFPKDEKLHREWIVKIRCDEGEEFRVVD